MSRLLLSVARVVSGLEATTSSSLSPSRRASSVWKSFSGNQLLGVNSGKSHFFSTRARQHMDELQKEARRKSVENASYLAAIVIGMVGVTYASVPLYRMFCQATGYGGTVQRAMTLEEKLSKATDPATEEEAALRELTIHFNCDITSGLNWKFTPTQRNVKTTPGESTLAFYTVKNLSDRAITGVSTYNVTPQKAGIYFNKIQCFCFEEQRLRPGEEIDMPVFFYIDKEFATDPNMKGIDTLTLSYTFFKVSEEGEEEEE